MIVFMVTPAKAKTSSLLKILLMRGEESLNQLAIYTSFV